MESIKDYYDYLKQFAPPFKIYPNPMRNDGVFVRQDIPNEPYPNARDMHGNPIFPAVPPKAQGLGFQIPLNEAQKLVGMFNDSKGK